MSSFKTSVRSDPKFEYGGLSFITIRSENLGRRGDICVFVPKAAKGLSDVPIYILLHGVYASAWTWALNGGAHLTLDQLISSGQIEPAVLVMPSDGLWGDGSSYISHDDARYDFWVVSDVPTAVIEHVPQVSTSSQICLGGLSMGGFGALSLGARFHETFSAISAHSAITHLDQMALFTNDLIVLHEEVRTRRSVMELLSENRAALPPFRFDCGTDDLLIEYNRALHNELVAQDIPHQYAEFSGSHDWTYWTEHLQDTLLFFDKAFEMK